jgi:hypothetical protein
MTVLYKESVAHLNINSRLLSTDFDTLSQTEANFYKLSPFIDPKRPPYFCNDAFEICWNLSKAMFLLKFSKKLLKTCSVINYDKIMRRQNKFVLS